MTQMTRRSQRMEIENTKNLIFDRLEGRDIEKAVQELVSKAEDVCIDDVGMPNGWTPDNEDQQMMFLDMVAEQLIKIYFTPKDQPAATIDDI